MRRASQQDGEGCQNQAHCPFERMIRVVRKVTGPSRPDSRSGASFPHGVNGPAGPRWTTL